VPPNAGILTEYFSLQLHFPFPISPFLSLSSILPVAATLPPLLNSHPIPLNALGRVIVIGSGVDFGLFLCYNIFDLLLEFAVFVCALILYILLRYYDFTGKCVTLDGKHVLCI